MVHDGLDIEAQGGVDDAGVLAIDLQDDGGLPGVVQSPAIQPRIEGERAREVNEM